MQMIQNSTQTMTSKEIADLTGKEHRHVKRDIENMLKTLEKDVSSFGHIYLDSYQREQAGYKLPYDETICLLTGYDVRARMAVIKRWKELEEAQPTPLDLNNPHALRAALLGYSEKVIALEAKITTDAPKVAFAEAIRAVDGVCSIEKIAKTIGIGRNKFFKRLRDDGILMANNLPYQKYLDREYFSVIEQEPYTDSKGDTHPTFTTRVTGAGQVFLARKYSVSVNQ